jgi:hypothetical protein
VVEPLSGATAFAFPGIATAREPLAWFDSLAVSAGEGAAWSGFGASLATAATGPEYAGPQHTRAMFHFLDGDFGMDETGLSVERGDSLRFLRGGAFSVNRGPRGPLGLAGHHVWGGAGRITFGEHAIEAGYNQRGAAANLQSGEEQSMAGESGRIAWRFRRGGMRAALAASRGRDAGESFLPDRDVDTWSRRDAERDEIALEAGSSRGERDAGARLSWSETHVRRSERPEFDRRARALWAAVRLTQPAGDGVIDLAAGAGHHDVFGGWDFAPSAAYRFTGGSFRGRVVLERLVAPVWTDLRTGVDPFLQRTWVAGWELSTDASGGAAGHLGMLLGSSRDRAIVERRPLEEQWLRNGLARDPGRYDFGLFTGSAAWRGKSFGARGEGFALAREKSAAQPAVDPPFGGRAALEYEFQPFQKELDIVLSAEVEGVGPRESEAPVPRRLEGYASFGLAGAFTLGEALVTIRARNLEDQARPQTRRPAAKRWASASSSGSRSPGSCSTESRENPPRARTPRWS